MKNSIKVGAKIKMTDNVTGDYLIGSTATILYIDEIDNIFVESQTNERQLFFYRSFALL